LRESPALAITLELGRLYPGQIVAVEPHIASTPAPLLAADIQLAELSVALEADVLVLLVDHKVFAAQTLQLRQDQRLLDTRGFFG